MCWKGAFTIGRCAGNAAPELRMDVVAIATRDEHLFDDVMVHPLAVNRGIALGPRWQWPVQKRIVELWIQGRASSHG